MSMRPDKHCFKHDAPYGECICYADPQPIFQSFWRCAHYPIATENFFEQLTACELGCHKQILRWYQNGEYPIENRYGELTVQFR